eukprot:296280_1
MTDVSRLFSQIGLVDCNKLTHTLQGSIWKGYRSSREEGAENKPVAIKITNKLLHQYSISIANDKIYRVNEDILVEQSILKFITQNEQCPKSIVKFNQFLITDTDYYLIMEDGGPSSLFDFLQIGHKLIKADKIEISHWKLVTKKK